MKVLGFEVDWKHALIVLGVALIAIKFRNQIVMAISHIPVVGPEIVKAVG